MARFYKTSSVAPEDYMYQLPVEMMANVLQFNEGQIANMENSRDLLESSLAQIKSLTRDNDEANSIIDSYNKQATDFTNQVLKDPVNWRKYAPNLRDLTRTVSNDFMRGDLSKIQGEYNKYLSFKSQADEMVKKGDLSPMTAKAMESYMMNNYKGFREGLNVEPLLKDYDLSAEFAKAFDKAKASGAINEGTNLTDALITLNTYGWEGISKDTALSGIMSYFNAHPEIQQSLAQRQRIGVPGYSDIIDSEGRFNFGSYEEVPITDASGKVVGTERQFRPAPNPLSQAINSALLESSYMKTKNSSVSDYNKLFLQNDSQAFQQQQALQDRIWDREDAERKNVLDKEKEDAKLERDKELIDYKAEIQKQINEGKISSTKGKAMVDNFVTEAQKKTLLGVVANYNDDVENRNLFRLNTITTSAKMTVNNQYKNDTDVENYLNWLGNRQSSPELVVEYYNKNFGENSKASVGEAGKVTVYSDITLPDGSKAYGGNYMQNIPIEKNQPLILAKKLEKAGENYNTSIEKQYRKQSEHQSTSSFEPITREGTKALAERINSTPSNYTVVKDGKEISLGSTGKKVTSVKRAAAANRRGNMAYEVVFQDNTEDIVFLNNKEQSSNLGEREVAAKYLANPNSAVAATLTDDFSNYILNSLESGVIVTRVDGKGYYENEINIDGNNYKIFRPRGSNEIYLQDKETNKTAKYDSLEQLRAVYYNRKN